MKFSDEQINSIAQNLQCGLISYINNNTGEIRELIDFDNSYGDDELFREELEFIEKNWKSYFTIEPMRSRDSFNIMRDFIPQIEDLSIQKELNFILERSKPFRHFKNKVEGNFDIREQWFEFRNAQYEEYVRDRIEIEFNS